MATQANRDLIEISHADWIARAKELFGDDPLAWRFVCPSCGYVASIADYKAAGAPRSAVAFNCIGRYTGATQEIGTQGGGPCNYTGGGLFRLNPVTVRFEDSAKAQVFAFAEACGAGRSEG
jgi:hypothetical protein